MNLLQALCKANQGVLRQKLLLMSALSERHGVQMAQELYRKTCPIVGATIGQHVRHSLDHVERAAASAATVSTSNAEIHYDLRLRDTADESDWSAASERIQRVHQVLEDLSLGRRSTPPNQPVDAYFMLSGDEQNAEYCLPSTVERELGFAAHHAIHHMAMVKIIATCSHVGQLDVTDLPADFGRAPSTVNHDHANGDIGTK